MTEYALTSYSLSIIKVGKSFRFICYNTGWLGSVMGVRDGPAWRGEAEPPKLCPWNDTTHPVNQPASLIKYVGTHYSIIHIEALVQF